MSEKRNMEKMQKICLQKREGCGGNFRGCAEGKNLS